MQKQKKPGILAAFKNTVKRYNLIGKGDKVLIGLSGGPDSVALTFLLNSLKKESGIKLHAAHLDHMLRPDSAGDAAFVRDLTCRLNIPLTAARVNLKNLRRYGSLEEIARNARLGFLFRVAKQIKADKIALGHNLDDQAETVLMRLFRGAGLQGLSGIAPKREIAGRTIIRPLIRIKRESIEAFLKKKGIRSRIDASNFDEIYFRNKIRNRLLPLLEREYNKNIKDILSNTAQSISEDYDYLNRAAILSAQRLGARINPGRFLKMHPGMQRMVLRLNIRRLKGDMRRITFKHIGEIEDLILNRPVNSIVDLPGGISVVKKKSSFFFVLKNKNS